MFASLTLLTLLPPLCAASCITRSRFTLLHVVKHVSCHVLETRMLHVMDGRVVSRGLCFMHVNPESQPS
jgi:hypothetical protein